MRVLADLEYSDLLTLDAYVPDAPLGAILLLHGGWLEGDKNGETVLAERLCKSDFSYSRRITAWIELARTAGR